MLVSKTKGKYRKKLRKHFPKKRYHRRSLVETVNFVEKIKMGDELTNTKWLMKKKKQRVKDIVYNIYRIHKGQQYDVVCVNGRFSALFPT
jgi:hypothetical protein